MRMNIYIVRLGGKDDDFIELGDVTEEIIYPGSFGGSPAVLAL